MINILRLIHKIMESWKFFNPGNDMPILIYIPRLEYTDWIVPLSCLHLIFSLFCVIVRVKLYIKDCLNTCFTFKIMEQSAF